MSTALTIFASKLLLALSLACSISTYSYANTSTNTTNTRNQQHDTTLIDAPELNNKAFVLMDFHTGQILAQKQPDLPLPPASLTKMMTSYILEQKLVNGEIKEDDAIPVSKYAACDLRKGESCMFLRAGKSASAMDILRGIVIQSGNDASRAVAEHIAGNEEAFAELMNKKAAELGLKDTNYRNSTGMPALGHESTARDLAQLARAIIEKNSKYYPVYAEKEFIYNNIRQHNRNRLLFSDSTVDGLKTGHTNEAGYCLVASSRKEDMRLISVVLGTDSKRARANQSRQLLKWGFDNFKTVVVMPKNHFIQKQRVWYGTPKNVNLGVADEFVVLLPKDESAQITTKTVIQPMLEAPLAKGTVVGEITAYLGDKKVASTDIQVMEAVEKAGFFARLWDGAKLFFKDLWAKVTG